MNEAGHTANFPEGLKIADQFTGPASSRPAAVSVPLVRGYLSFTRHGSCFPLFR